MTPPSPVLTRERCTGCGTCVSICPARVLELEAGHVRIRRPHWCLGCGHCASVCPPGALRHPRTARNAGPPHPFPTGHPGIAEASYRVQDLLALIHRRRSIRRYADRPVDIAHLDRLLEAARGAPTGCNSRSTRFVVFRGPEAVASLRRRTLHYYRRQYRRLRPLGPVVGAFERLPVPGLEPFRDLLPRAKETFLPEDPSRDPLFYGAPVVLVVHAPRADPSSAFNGAAALYAVCLEATALGLGTCLNGFLQHALNRDRPLRRWAGLPRWHRCYGAAVAGWAAITHRRAVHRSPVPVTWR